MNECPDCGKFIYEDAVHICETAPYEAAPYEPGLVECPVHADAEMHALQIGYAAARLEIQTLRATVADLEDRLRAAHTVEDDWK